MTDTNRRAARYVAQHAPGTPAERLELLAALGLVVAPGVHDEQGKWQVAPEDEPYLTGNDMAALGTVGASVLSGHVDHAMSADTKVRPAVSTAPPGLRNYEPTGPEPTLARRRGAA